jgi:hypothetical protein
LKLLKTYTESTSTLEFWLNAPLFTSSCLCKYCKPAQDQLLALVKVSMMLLHWKKQMSVSAWVLASRLQRTLHKSFSLTITSSQCIVPPCGEETWLTVSVSSSSSS